MLDKFLAGFERPLVISPHTDDEFGCGGTVARLVRAGVPIRYLALSRCEASVPAGFPIDVLEHECRACATALGIKPEMISVERFPVRYFPAHRQEILELFVKIAREYKPDLVLLPCSVDIHQDHHTVYEEGFRAFKHSTILGYELPQNTVGFANTAYVRLTEQDIDTKIAALYHYESQRFRAYAAPEFIRGLARLRGVQCANEYAEAFEVIRLIV